MRIIERKDAKYLLFGILEISEKKRENHSNSEKKHFERKEASQMCLASFHIKRDTEKSISANLGIFLPRQCPCSRTTVLKNTRRPGCPFSGRASDHLCCRDRDHGFADRTVPLFLPGYGTAGIWRPDDVDRYPAFPVSVHRIRTFPL